MSSDMSNEIPGVVDLATVGAIRRLEAGGQLTRFIRWHAEKLMNDPEIGIARLTLLASTRSGSLRRLEASLRDHVDDALCDKKIGVVNLSLELDGIDGAEDRKWGLLEAYLRNSSADILIAVSPSGYDRAGAAFFPEDPASLLNWGLSHELLSACRYAVGRNKVGASLPGAQPSLQDDAVRIAMGRAPVRFPVVCALVDCGVRPIKLEDLVRRCATSIRHQPENEHFSIIEKAVSVWIDSVEISLPKVLVVCIGDTEGDVDDFLGLIGEFRWHHDQYVNQCMKGWLSKPFAESADGIRAAVIGEA